MDVSVKRYIKETLGKDEIFAQTMTLKCSNFAVTFIYINRTPTFNEVERINQTTQYSNIIMGDLNLDPSRDDEDQRKMSILMGHHKKRVLHEVTSKRNNNQLDHILMDKNLCSEYFSTSYNNYTSDHKAITIRIPFAGNKFSDDFKKDLNLNNDQWTKKVPKTINRNTQPLDETNSVLVIDKYVELLNESSQNKVIFHSSFFKDFIENGYDKLCSSFKDKKIIDATDAFIIIKDVHDNADKIIHWSKQDLILTQKPSQASLLNHQDSLKLLIHLKAKYINALYDSFSFEQPSLKCNVEEFNQDHDGPDYQFHILTVLKHKIFNKALDSEVSLMKEKGNILSEVKSNRIFPISKPKRKRTEDDDHESSENKRTRRAFRSFRNPLMESCWLNSCMQLVFAALDHTSELATNGSPLWKLLTQFKMKEAVEIINPLEIRDMLLAKERDRILLNGVRPENRLFHYADTNIMNKSRLKSLSEASRIGQQDCKDFFVCIEQNKEHWADVYNLFEFSTTKSTLCYNCQAESRPPNNDKQSFIMLDCPQYDVTLSQYIGKHLNESTTVSNWRHEEGCNRIGEASNKIRLVNVENTQFITIIVNRLMRDTHGNLTISKKKIQPEPVVNIKDANDDVHNFKPIAVIYHIGHVENNDTRGHYMADVCDVKTGKWYKTSDDATPTETSAVTERGYIFLLKKV